MRRCVRRGAPVRKPTRGILQKHSHECSSDSPGPAAQAKYGSGETVMVGGKVLLLCMFKTPLCKESDLCPFMSQICACKFSVREMFLLAGVPRKHV